MPWRLVVAAITVAMGCAQPTAVAAVEDFFRGKNMRMVLPTVPGGTIPLYGNALAEFMSRHIPGRPTIVPEYRPGGGGLVAAGYVYNVAPKDGTVITMLINAILTAQLLQPETVNLDMAKFSHVGRVVDGRRALIAWHTAGLNSIEDTKKREVPLGASGKGSLTITHPVLLNAIVGTRFKIVGGYRGAGDTYLALERGELDATTVTWDGLVSERGEWLRNGLVKVLLRLGHREFAGFESVPVMTDLAKTAEDRAVLELALTPSEIGQSVVAPPGIPAERLQALRRAFDLTMKDPDFLAFARKRDMPIAPMSGDELRRLIERGISTPSDVVQRMNKLTKGL